jgi:hypothetical protein
MFKVGDQIDLHTAFSKNGRFQVLGTMSGPAGTLYKLGDADRHVYHYSSEFVHLNGSLAQSNVSAAGFFSKFFSLMFGV